MPDKSLIPISAVESRILFVRGHRVIIDADLADLFKVPTKRLNEQVKRNIDRFPEDFMFRFTKAEKDQLVANCDHLRKLKFSPNLPYAFTEYGTIMAANVINSPVAIESSISIVRAFVRLREMISAHKDLARRLDGLEKRYDKQFRAVFDAIRELMAPPEQDKNAKRVIGFIPGE